MVYGPQDICHAKQSQIDMIDEHSGLKGMTLPAHDCITFHVELTAACETKLTLDFRESDKADGPDSESGRRTGSKTASLLMILAQGGWCWTEPAAVLLAAADALSSEGNAAASPGF